MTRGSEGEAAPCKRKGTVPARSLSPLLFENGTGEDTESSAAAQEHKKKKKVKEKRAEHGQLKEAGERDDGHKKKKVKHSDGDENLEAETTEEVEIPLKKKKKKKHRRDVMEQEGESNDDVNPSGQPKDEESCLEAVGSERKEVKVEIKGSYPVTPWTAEEKKKKKRKQREAGLEETGQGASDQSSGDLSAKKKKKQKATNSIQVPPSDIDEPVEASSSKDPGRQVGPTWSSSKMKKRRSDVDEPAERSGVDPGQSPGGSGKEKKRKMVNESQLLETTVDESGESVIVSRADLIQTPGGSRKKTKHEIVNQSQEPQLDVENSEAASCKAKSSQVGEEELASMMEQLKEFVTNVEKLSAAVIVEMAKYDLNRFREFKKKRFGRFTAEENNRLRQNVEDFLSLSGIDRPQKLFYSSRYPEEKNTIKQLKVQYRFLTRICKNKGRWSYKERRILLKVMEDELRKTLDPAEMTDLEQGATPERNARLLTIIREKLYQNIHWVDVAAKVKTCNWVQCRQKCCDRCPLMESPPVCSATYDIIDFLHENTVPALKEKISKTRRHDKEGVRDSYECHKTFNFSDIFYESDTDLETEELDQEM
ncbi:UNVERIFIED_CONTAM: hypothetical protein FKN15_061892 [Acipenser sinensis]